MNDHYWGDLIFFSGIAGALAAPIKRFFHHLFVWAKLAAPFYSDLNAYLIHGHHKITGVIENIFAEMGDMMIGALFGIILGFWLKHSRPKLHWGIGLGFGFGIWFISLVFGNLTKIIRPGQTSDWSLASHLIGMQIFGLLFVVATKIWKPLRERIGRLL